MNYIRQLTSILDPNRRRLALGTGFESRWVLVRVEEIMDAGICLVARACFGIDIHVVEKDQKNVLRVKVW